MVFPPAGLASAASAALLRWRPPRVPAATLWVGTALQASLWVLTAALWGRCQGRIARRSADAPSPTSGPANRTLHEKLVASHWLRVALITAHVLLQLWLGHRELVGSPGP